MGTKSGVIGAVLSHTNACARSRMRYGRGRQSAGRKGILEALMSAATPRRVIMRIELTPPAKTRLTQISDETGMTQVSIMSRLTTWFAEQPELIQAAVLGRYPKEIESDVAKLLLQRMAGEKG